MELEEQENVLSRVLQSIDNPGGQAAGLATEVGTGLALDKVTSPLLAGGPLGWAGYGIINFGGGAASNYAAQRIRGEEDTDWGEVLSSGLLGIIPFSSIKLGKRATQIAGEAGTVKRAVVGGAGMGAGDQFIRSGLEGELPSPTNLAVGTVAGGALGGTFQKSFDEFGKILDNFKAKGIPVEDIPKAITKDPKASRHLSLLKKQILEAHASGDSHLVSRLIFDYRKKHGVHGLEANYETYDEYIKIHGDQNKNNLRGQLNDAIDGKPFRFNPENYGPETLYSKSELDTFYEEAYRHRLERSKVAKRDYMKDFTGKLPLRGGEVILVKKRGLRDRGNPIAKENYELRYLQEVEDKMLKDAGWVREISEQTTEMQNLRSALNRLKQEHPDRYYHSLMEYGDEAYIEHKLARGQGWFWNRRENRSKRKGPPFAPWAIARSRNDVKNLRLLFNASFKTLKDTAERRLEGRMKKISLDQNKFVIDLEDPQVNKYKSNDLFKASNPGNLLIRQANSGQIIGILGDYMQELYSSQMPRNFNVSKLYGRDVPARYKAKYRADNEKLESEIVTKAKGVKESWLQYRDRIFQERFDLIMKEKGNFTLQEMQAEVFKDMVDFYDLFAGKLGWVRKPQYISDVQKKYGSSDPRLSEVSLKETDRKLVEDFYKLKNRELASIQEGIRDYQTGQSTMTKKDYNELIKLYNQVSAREFN